MTDATQTSHMAAPAAAPGLLDELKARRDVSFAKRGLLLALVSGILWGGNGVLLSLPFSAPVFSDERFWLLAPLTVGALHDTWVTLWLLAFNGATGRLRELARTLTSRSALRVALGAVFGGPMAMSAYMLGVKFAGPAYVMPITALYPAVASILAGVFLKERIRGLAWAGMALCVAGGVVIGYTPPAGALGADFYFGIAMAVVATVGWGIEGVLATSGMDLLDPVAALNVRELTSSAVYLLAVLPLAGGYALIGGGLASSIGWIFPVAALAGSASYYCWYRAMNTTGVSRAMSLNITYSIWGILFSALLTPTQITVSLILGAALILAGMLLVVGDPRAMANLRNVN